MIPGHFISLCSAGAARAEFERQGAQDWESFLSLRAGELLPGGRLVVVLPGIAENGSSGFERIMNQLLAPFARNGRFQDLAVEAFDESVLSDWAWADYERNGDSEVLAAKHAAFFRSVFMPSLASALTRVRNGDPEALTAFGNQLEEGLKRRLANQPAAMHSFVHTIVLAKWS